MERFLEARKYAEEVGERLLIEKQKVPNGEWQFWLQINCPDIPLRTSQWYISLISRKSLQMNEAMRNVAHPPPDLQALRKLLLIGEVLRPPIPNSEPAHSTGATEISRQMVQIEMLGLYGKRWISSVFQAHKTEADAGQLEYWLTYLRPLHEAYIEIGQLLTSLTA